MLEHFNNILSFSSDIVSDNRHGAKPLWWKENYLAVLLAVNCCILFVASYLFLVQQIHSGVAKYKQLKFT